MDKEPRNKSGCSWLHVMVLAVSALLIALMFPPCFFGIVDKSHEATTAGNCRQIIAALAMYAAEHEGKYPDTDPSMPTTGNQALRVLIRNDVLQDERVFCAMSGAFLPDNIIGEPPDYHQALEAGENHWAMTKGATNKLIPRTPLVFENPASATWPPTWNVDAARTKTRGRAWSGGKIIVGFNDQTVELISLQSGRGTNVPPARSADGKDIFTRAAPKMEILDIEE